MSIYERPVACKFWKGYCVDIYIIQLPGPSYRAKGKKKKFTYVEKHDSHKYWAKEAWHLKNAWRMMTYNKINNVRNKYLYYKTIKKILQVLAIQTDGNDPRVWGCNIIGNRLSEHHWGVGNVVSLNMGNVFYID